MEISAQLVKELRLQTGAGMMDCKKALTEAAGEIDKAVKILREKGIAKAAKKSGRETSEGIIASYIHPGDKLGVMVEVNSETDFVARTTAFQSFVRDIAMHIAATNPDCVSRDAVDQSNMEEEREILRTQAINDGKPANIVDKIVDGRMEKYYTEHVLLDQPFVKDNDKTVGDYLQETIGSLGENISIKRFARFQLGE
jgi:elongation factor Ts